MEKFKGFDISTCHFCCGKNTFPAKFIVSLHFNLNCGIAVSMCEKHKEEFLKDTEPFIEKIRLMYEVQTKKAINPYCFICGNEIDTVLDKKINENHHCLAYLCETHFKKEKKSIDSFMDMWSKDEIKQIVELKI